jgi:hypothetical protein
MEAKQFNLIVTCKFSDFARAYTGLDDPEDHIAFIEKQDQMWFVNSQRGGEFLTKADLIAISDSLVEIRVDSQMENNGIYILNLTVTTPDDNSPYNGSIIECDCTDLEGVLHEIITHTFRY